MLFVTHKLHEVTAITDRVTILRDGRTVASLRTADTDAGEIVRAMTGRNVNLKVEKRPLQPGDPLLKAVDVTIASPSGKLAVDRVSLTVRGGEIVGIAGVAGNGQSELVEALVGLRNPDGGRVEVCGRDVTRVGCRGASRRRPRLYPRGSRRRRLGGGGERRRQSCDGIPSQPLRSPAGPSSIRRRSPNGRARSSGASPSESQTNA